MNEQTIQQPNPVEKLLFRRKLRSSLLEWCTFVEGKKGQIPAAHHRLIIEHLQRVTEGTQGNTMLLMPPGAAKSTYTSVDFPPWYLNRHPHNLILACSYKYELIEGFGRQCRDLIHQYQNELGYRLSKTASASGDWRIRKDNLETGGYFCAGVNAGIAGHRASLGFIDDYIGSQEDADSESNREKNWKWFWNDFWPRLWPGAPIVIIANRRHEDDLVGRLLAQEADNWTVVKLPYFAEENDPLGRPRGVKWDEQKEEMIYDVSSRLWPEWFNEKHAADVVKLARSEPRTLAGLYQQRPAPDEGNFFRRNMLVGYSMDDLKTAEEGGMRYYVGADYAVRKGQENDRFCFICVGVDSAGVIWVLPDWYWTTADTLEATEAMLAMNKRRKPLYWWAGKENITGSIGPFVRKLMVERNNYVAIDELSEAKDKQAKAQPIKARMAQKMVRFPKWAPSWNEAEGELLGFPGGTHDDFVDALAKIGIGLEHIVPAERQQPLPKDNLAAYNHRITFGGIKESHRRLEREERLWRADK